MTSSKFNGNIFRITGPLQGESAGHRWISLTKASDSWLWYFLWCAPEQTTEQTVEMLVIWNTMVLIMASLYYTWNVTVSVLTYCGLATQYGDIELCQYWLR